MEEGAVDLRIHLPKNVLLVGATQSGKSHFIKKMLEENQSVFTPKYVYVIYCYGAWQKMYEDLQSSLGDKIVFRQDIPTKEELIQISEEIRGPIVLVLDDKMTTSLTDNKRGGEILETICVTAHHYNVTCLTAIQSLYHNKLIKEISLNSHYLVLFRNNRNYSQIRILASQIMPGHLDYFTDSYDKATSKLYGYLVIDLSPTCNRLYQLRTNIFGNEDTIIFTPKK